MKTRFLFAALAAGLTLIATGASGQSPQALSPRAAAAPSSTAPEATVAPGAAPALTKADLDAWLDGYLPYALANADIAGAAVVVVKDGQVLTEKGYGYADLKSHRRVDPRVTLFRPGSVSKLVTWTAVMQQVEAGKIDLDADVNRYLDFKIPPYEGRPVTMRDLMTHTAGFAETIKHLFPSSPKGLMPLGTFLKTWTPNRIFPPGTTPAYSNYGAALAGYVVERVSGEPFNAYVARHVFAPLGMSHSTFDQPLPAEMKPNMASGYLLASVPKPAPYELVGPGPAGALVTTADDMTRFMLAHLNGGQFGSARILQPATEALMQAPQKPYVPPLNGMALGFYHEDRNGHVIVGHGGDTVVFHSDLHLLPNDGVGIFLSMNSRGKGGLVETIRQDLLAGFMDRYYPAPRPDLPAIATAKAHAALMQGHYWSSRRVSSGYLRMINLIGQTKVAAGPDGTITVSAMRDEAEAPLVWHETAPFVWKDASGRHTLAAAVQDGKVAYFSEDDLGAIMLFQPAPAFIDAGWNLPLLGAMCGVLALMAALWPIQVLVRRRYGQRFALAGRAAWLYRGVRVAGVVDLVALASFVAIAQSANTNLGIFDDPLDLWLRVLQLLCLVGVAGAALSVWNAVEVYRDGARSWWAKVSATAIALALLSFVWFVAILQLVSPSLNY
jgi:CubicO group peptidase (beta-lactamase class C family)